MARGFPTYRSYVIRGFVGCKAGHLEATGSNDQKPPKQAFFNGEGEIRTPATLAGRPVFETASRSANYLNNSGVLGLSDAIPTQISYVDGTCRLSGIRTGIAESSPPYTPYRANTPSKLARVGADDRAAKLAKAGAA